MDEEPAFCADCGSSRQVVWCPAFDAFLCPGHRHERSYQLLDATVTALPVKP